MTSRAGCRVKQGMHAVVHSGMLRDGAVAVQDEAAGLVVALLDPQPGERILDACAAPGGKALFAAQRMHERAGVDTCKAGVVLAMDVHPQRLGLVSKAAAAAGVDHIVKTVAADLREVVHSRCFLAASCRGAYLQCTSPRSPLAVLR